MSTRIKALLCTLLFMLSLSAVAFCGYQFCLYFADEAQSDALWAELAALHAASGSQNSGATGQNSISQDDSRGEAADDDVIQGTDWIMTYNNADSDSANNESEVSSADGSAASNDSAAADLPAVSVHGITALHERNRDCIGWLSIPGTVIDYPVMHTPSRKNYYLYRDFNGRKSYNGTLYVSEICDPDTSDNVIIYGHNMRSGKMFASLTNYKQKAYYEAHRYIVFETMNGVYLYEVMYALTTPVYTSHDFRYYSFADAANADEFNAYVSACASRALYDTGATASYGDHLLTLCTCEYSQDNGRMLVVAKRIGSYSA